GSVAFTISPEGAAWSATSSADWLTLTAASGSGSGTIAWSYTANNSITPRVATITTLGQTLTVIQAGAALNLSPSSAAVGPAAGSAALTFTVTPAANWTAVSSAAWLTVSPQSGNANAALTYSWTANSSAKAREATITIGSSSFTLVQRGADGSFTPWGTSGYGQIRTIAGSGSGGFSGDSGPATAASLSSPSGVAVDANGNVYIADTGNNGIRRVDAVTGKITTVAGSVYSGLAGDGSAATSASLYQPSGVALDRAGNLFIADTSNSRVRRVDAVTGIITTVAGGGNYGLGDNGPAVLASLNSPRAVIVDAYGDLFLADASSQRVRRVDGVTGIITTVAGTGSLGVTGDGGLATAALLNTPSALALDPMGNLLIADSGNSRIRRVDASTGNITTVAGNGCCGFAGDGGAAKSALLNSPAGIAADKAGNLYIADTSDNRIRRVDAVTGVITTIAGSSFPGFSGDGGPSAAASLNAPAGLVIGNDGNLYFADRSNLRIRVVDLSSPQVILSAASAAVPVSSGTGNVGLTISPAGSAWIATSDAAWLTLTTPSGTGDGTVGYAFTANNSLSARTGTISVLGQTLTVTQAAAAVTLSAAYASTAPAAGSGTVLLTVAPSAPWTASSNSSWLTVTPASGNGTTTIAWTCTANTSTAARTAILTIAGELFTFVQLGSSGSYTPWGPGTSPGQITAIAGNGTAGFSGDGGASPAAQLNQAGGVAIDAKANLYIADSLNNRIRKVDPVTHVITTVAGNGSGGSAGDGGPATSAQLHGPQGLAVDARGNLFIADTLNSRIRRVDSATGTITTVAGSAPCCGYGGDGGLATAASLYNPKAVALDAGGNLFIADTNNGRIRRVDASTGIITTVAGYCCGYNGDGIPAVFATLNSPQGIALDSGGNLYIADQTNMRVRRVDAATGIISTVAGNGQCCTPGDNGPAISANLYPAGVAVDLSGNLFISTSSGIRRVDPATGLITTIAASPGTGLAADITGNLYIANSTSSRVLFVDFSSPRVTLAAPQTNTVSASGAGSVALTISPGGAIWYASSNAPWLTLTNASGEGNGAINYSFTANNSLSPRTGLIDVYGQTFAVTQSGATVALSSSSAIVDNSAGSGVVNLTVTPAAAWTASSSASWLTISPASGNAGASLTYSVATNPGSAPRTAAVTVGDTSFTVLQLGSAVAYNVWNSDAWGTIRTIAALAQLNNPTGVAVDAAGNVYIVDTVAGSIRRVDAATGTITTIASQCCAAPTSLTLDAAGNLYFADWARICRVDAATKAITTVAGNNILGFSGDGGLATLAQLDAPQGLVADAWGNLYVADSGNNRIRRVDAATGLITTVAGTGSVGSNGDDGPALAAQLNDPRAVALDRAGNLFIADTLNNRIRKVDVSTGLITAVAGTGTPGYGGDGSQADLALLFDPQGIAVDGKGNLFISDTGNSRIRRVDGASGVITTVFGNNSCCSGFGVPGLPGQPNSPRGLAVDGTGNLYIADSGAHRVEFIDYTTPEIVLSASSV
ncbi:MAG TPA: BACON domain-containing carbohydrate-binding protein, partial [Bryobacteraceae bacterium]|nr:BACON domain-containing carbohydrate-binding protein [Bryobacteraceae bacterium]